MTEYYRVTVSKVLAVNGGREVYTHHVSNDVGCATQLQVDPHVVDSIRYRTPSYEKLA